MKVEVENKTKHVIILEQFEKLMRCAEKVLRLPKESLVQIFIVEPNEIRALNRRTRKVNCVTDVLSFPLHDLGKMEKNAEGHFALGDIVICADYAFNNAQAEGREKEFELFFLAIHGLLHLCGHDHNTDRAQNKMDKVANKILSCYNNL